MLGNRQEKLSSSLPDEDTPFRSIKRGKPSASKDVKLLGAGTDERDFFATEVIDRFTCDITIRFLRALQDEYGEKIRTLLDNAFYFKSQQVRDFVEETAIEKRSFRADHRILPLLKSAGDS